MNKLLTRLSIIGVFTLVIAINSFAQDCKDVKEKKDPFNNAITQYFKFRIGPVFGAYVMSVEKKDTNYTMSIEAVSKGFFDKSLSAGHKLLFKLANDKLVDLETSEETRPLLTGTNGQALTNWKITFIVPSKMMRRLAHSPIVAVKIEIPGRDEILPGVTEKKMTTVMDAFSCIIGEVKQ